MASSDGAVTPIDTASDKAGQPIPVAGDLGAMAITPDSKILLVGATGGRADQRRPRTRQSGHRSPTASI